MRVLLRPCTLAELADETDLEATAQQVTENMLWYCLTPDLDVYAHLLDSPPHAGIVAFSNTGDAIPGSRLGRQWSARSVVYGANWQPSALELCEGLQLTHEGVTPRAAPEPPKKHSGSD